MLRKLIAGLGVVAAVAATGGCGTSQVPGNIDRDDSPGTGPAPTVKVLSNRADLVSGDDVLVEIGLPAGAARAALQLDAGGRDVSSAIATLDDGRIMARVTGLALGRNVVTARLAGGGSGSVEIVNHPNGGPIFSGPQIQPWSCPAESLDAQCNRPAEYTYLYKSSSPLRFGLLPYDPENPPTDVATTTTDQGVTVPFIVRQELGYQDRDQYKILQLFQPGQPWEPWAPQQQWNHKVLVTHGGGCGSDHGAGGAPLDDFSGTFGDLPAYESSYVMALGLGFAVMSTALDNLGHNCNVVVAAESLMMAKERLIEQYGPIRYTIGTGCSGGSITQMMVANAYPGIYQGSITTCAYPDVFSTGAQFADLHLLRRYFEPDLMTGSVMWGPGVVWTPDQMAAVEGNISHLNAITTDELFFKSVTAPTGDCAGDASYDPATNPGGKRCGLMDYLVNLLDTRPQEVWSPMEIAAGKGFAGNPIDNTGIQYGLGALRAGRILPSQFVDLNAKIGGLDIDIQPQAARTIGDEPAIANAYRSGELNVTNNLDRTAIINVSGPDPGAAHDTVHGFWTRWRLEREFGHHDNHVLWAGPVALVGDLTGMKKGLVAMDAWLARVEQDLRDIPLAQKLTANKPEDLRDACTDGLGLEIGGPACLALLEPVLYYSSPRAVAGAPRADDIIKCQLKPFSRDDDYGLIPFTEAQWQQLEEIFEDGVCDYSLPGVSQQGAVEWMTYQDAQGHAVYGGTALPPAPANSGTGWASPAFGVFTSP